ncbi:hypothetical protein O181_004488 [Austropuccinia psidii MF-1]|uniref:Uncharacterized protein n=1 Tax=Austropuccinia psidii MF-1 TaxID=1389203 RepID=A0A9Q3BGP4_9BASI|nr:hypothetical protein [Austropuccinia psidii MF-1]
MKFHLKTHALSPIRNNSNQHQSSSSLNDLLSLTHDSMVMPKSMVVNQELVQIDSNPKTSSNKPTHSSATREQRRLIKNETQALQKSGTKHKQMRNVSVLSIIAKKDNQTCFELPPMNIYTNTYILLNDTVPS